MLYCVWDGEGNVYYFGAEWFRAEKAMDYIESVKKDIAHTLVVADPPM